MSYQLVTDPTAAGFFFCAGFPRTALHEVSHSGHDSIRIQRDAGLI